MAGLVKCRMLLLFQALLLRHCGGSSSDVRTVVAGARVQTQSDASNSTLAADPNTYKICDYSVVIKTGNQVGAGTESVISLRLANSGGEDVLFMALDNGKRHFERGHTDTFQLTGHCVAHICKMTLYTDDTWYFGSWFVDTVAFSASTDVGPQERSWDVYQWLPRNDDAAELFVTVDDC